MAEAPPAIGIDLGTTYSVVSVFRKRKVEIIQNDAGSRTTPSYVAFTDDKEYVGQAAKELATSNTLFDSKRLLGRRFDDAELEKDLENWPFTVKNDGGVPKYEITLDGIPRMISPEEISSKILKAMKITAEESFGHECEVMKAVVTVPAYFNDSQRQATMTAGRLAGLEVIAILNEPTAAAMAFGFGAKKNSTTLIFDLGGGTFDVTVLKIRGDNFNTLAHGGDTHLGGQDFDNILLTHVLDDIEKKEGVRINRDDDIEVFHEIRAQCELVKRRLSTLPQATINVFLSRHGKGYRREISRAFFEDLCTPFFKRAIDILPGVLKDAGVTKEQIDEVVLVGGSTRIPKVRSMLQQFFDGKELNKSINPDEAVAQGAAIYAASLTGVAGAKQVRMKDVSSLSLGVAQSTGLMAVLIPRNSALPCSVTKPFTTASDQQEEAEIKICQGERARWQDNDILGDFTLSVPARPKGEVDIDTTFSLDENGVLTVTAVEVSSGEKASVTVQSESRLTERELQQLLAQAQRFRLEDEESRDRARRERFQV